MQYLKLAIILIVVYYLYITFIYKENFTLTSGTTDPVATSKTQLKPGVFYRKGILKQGVFNTINNALNGGQSCSEFPSEIYIPVAPIDAVCDFGINNINAYVPITETQASCGYSNNTKTLNKITDVTTFNSATTRTQPLYGGKDCFTQESLTLKLPSTKTFPCTTPIAANCQGGDFTGTISNTNANYTVDTSVTQLGSYWSAL